MRRNGVYMKKILVLMLALCLLISLMLFSACGDEGDTTANTTTDSGTVTTTEGGNSTTTTTEGAVITPAPSETVTKDENSVTVKSLGGKLLMKLAKTSDGEIVYTLSTADGKTVIGESAMGITANGFAGFKNATIKDATAKELKVSYNHLGTFSILTDHCVAATVTLENGGYEFAVEIKLYDNGVAFRYNLPKTNASRTVTGEATTFAVQNIGKVWYATNSDCYESSIKGTAYASIKTGDKLTGPLMIELANGAGYVTLMEGFVQAGDYIGTAYASVGSGNAFKIIGSWSGDKDFDAFSATGDVVSGWRIINYSTELGDIVTNNNIYHTALGMDGATSSYTDTDWITPGKSTWSWLTGDGVTFESQLNYTLNAAKLGFTYNIIDEGYLNWENNEEKLLELGLLGDDVNVKQILWAAVTPRNGWRITDAATAKSVMKKIADLHLSGIKLDFFNPETNITTHEIQAATLAEGMANHLVVNFHGVHKPTAYSVLYPNELTREAIRGLECLSKSDITTQAAYFTSQYYTRLLSGHADFTPEVDTAMQMASLIVLDSPMMVLANSPEALLASPALEMARAIPTVWDQTVFLDGKIGSYVSLAKEKSGVWYIGGIASENTVATVDLSKILGEGEYLLTGWVDDSTSKKVEKTETVTKNTKLELGTIANGCGYVFQITKLAISQHGGEITGPITVTKANAASVVKYTTDGSNPMTSATAVTAGDTITLTDTALLRIAIVEGDGKGTELTYQFNKLSYNSVDSAIVYGDGKSTVTLTPTAEGATVYYTTDGTTPTTASTRYTAPVEFTSGVTLKAIAVTADGKVSAVRVVTVLVRASVPSVKPDVYLGKNYTEAKTDWGKIRVDISMNDTVLSLGGLTAGSGTKFEHGISANANAYFVYNIPENATGFVGVAGIDDFTYENTAEGYKASTIVKIYIDGVLKYTTKRLGQGQYEQIGVEIPAGAKVLKIEFGDAGDGITCDNVDLCDAGFLFGGDIPDSGNDRDTFDTPDVYIGGEYTEAKTDWGSIAVDKSMNNSTLSLGGYNYTFEHGISANANAYFVYNIPENATEFIGVAGIDDSTYDNDRDGNKASTVVKIYVDGVLKYTTAKLGQSDYEKIRVEIPAGAKVLKIEFGDAGDGITCDNVDLCDAGFMLAN